MTKTTRLIAAIIGDAARHIDEETSRKLFWTVNKRILACMLGTYFCQSLDKGTLGFASIMNIQNDAHLVGQQYSWLGTILYMGVLVVVACSAAATNFAGLMTCRFLLGIFESCVQPVFIIMTSMWYTKREQAVLTSLWYCMTGVQLMVGGIIAWGVSDYTNAVIFPWQLLFLVLGLATCAWAVFLGWWLPDSPMLEAVTDPVVWCYVMLQLTSTLIIGGLGVFSNLIIASFGFTYLQTQLLNIAQGVVTIIVMVGSASLATWTKQTAWVMHAWTVPAILGTAIIYTIPPNESNRVGLLIAFYCTQFYLAEGNLIFSLISRNIAGQTKKSTTLAIAFVAWAARNMAAPQIFQQSDAPRYQKGFTAHFCLYVLFNLFLVVLRLLLVRRNQAKRFAHAGLAANETGGDLAEETGDEKIRHEHAFEDLTDKENLDFRYDV
ncbi:MFS general substrate transporter [Canariomyces notabilis]|uniref:MFS general substrate transporter n=1 Tax=Canariomyces notabilis TaxID=2074819 RepID=A0AAN6TIM9_9PEZI|nr:MFS general substrate transporter [Canariomyces arenarius]